MDVKVLFCSQRLFVNESVRATKVGDCGGVDGVVVEDGGGGVCGVEGGVANTGKFLRVRLQIWRIPSARWFEGIRPADEILTFVHFPKA